MVSLIGISSFSVDLDFVLEDSALDELPVCSFFLVELFSVALLLDDSFALDLAVFLVTLLLLFFLLGTVLSGTAVDDGIGPP